VEREILALRADDDGFHLPQIAWFGILSTSCCGGLMRGGFEPSALTIPILIHLTVAA
jgi:hypothetical protein